MSPIVLTSGVASLALLALGSGILMPIGTTLGGVIDLAAIAVGMVAFGLIDAD